KNTTSRQDKCTHQVKIPNPNEESTTAMKEKGVTESKGNTEIDAAKLPTRTNLHKQNNAQ
ncbi:30019_t:CDS:2, partial [Racocetra persica]